MLEMGEIKPDAQWPRFEKSWQKLGIFSILQVLFMTSVAEHVSGLQILIWVYLHILEHLTKLLILIH